MVLFWSVAVAEAAPYTCSVTGTFMTPAVLGNSSTLLKNGKVLVVSGDAEVYDPATETLTPTSSTGGIPAYHKAVLLPNGKVLVVGGMEGDMCSVARCSLFDPESGTWTATGSLNHGRYYHSAVLLPNGKVLVAGGHTSLRSYNTTTELYDPWTGTWALSSQLPFELGQCSTALLASGTVLLVGSYSQKTLLYDPGTENCTITGTLSIEHYSPTTTVLPNGKVLLVGDFNQTVVGRTELYDPATGQWTLTGPCLYPRYDHAAVLLQNGMVLVLGGWRESGVKTEVYDPATETWSLAGDMAVSRAHNPTATAMGNGKVLIAGGHWYYDKNDDSRLELFESGKVTDPPVFTVQPNSVSAYLNTTSSLTAYVIGSQLKYQWRKNGKNIPYADKREYAVATTLGSVGSYDLVVTNPYGSAISRPASVSIAAQPHIVKSSTLGRYLLSVSPEVPGDWSFDWRRNGKDLGDTRDPSSIEVDPWAEGVGFYTCVMTSKAGKVVTVPMAVNRQQVPNLFYRISSQGAKFQEGVKATAVAAGYFILDPNNQRGCFIWLVRNGAVKIFYTDVREKLAMFSTGPSPKGATVVVGDEQNVLPAGTEHSMIWLRGSDSVIKDPVSSAQLIAPLTLAGNISSLHLADSPQIDEFRAFLKFDVRRTFANRSDLDLQSVLQKFCAELQADGYLPAQQ